MPKTTPPPPPQPTVEQTVDAVRLVRWLALGTLALFLAWAGTYSGSSAMVSYGRDNGASWNLRSARRLDVVALRSHEGGRIVWLVGSSILREAFDETVINEVLGQLGSPYRVRKFGQTRGASGLSQGMLSRLPIEPGDLVVHNLAVENFRAEWLSFTDIPDYRVLMLLDDARIWQIKEWSIAAKLELLVARPQDFYRYQEEAMEGWYRWFRAPAEGKLPKKRSRSFHIRFKSLQEHRKLSMVRAKGELSRNVIGSGELDLSDAQFNMQGLQWMREDCARLGVPLILVDLPQRQEYRELYLQPGVWEAWSQWMEQQPELVHFPQPPDDDFYDMKHPNSRGRLMLSTHLVQWLSDRHSGLEGDVIDNRAPGEME